MWIVTIPKYGLRREKVWSMAGMNSRKLGFLGNRVSSPHLGDGGIVNAYSGFNKNTTYLDRVLMTASRPVRRVNSSEIG